MDPITVNKLLSVADAIETHRVDNQLSLETFHDLIASQGQLKNPIRRARDILRVFESSHWITRSAQTPDTLCLTEDFHEFIRAWNSGEHLLPMNQALANYPPYARFLECLKAEKSIKIPERYDKKSRSELGHELKEKYNVTFVAFDTFRTWAVSLGHAYRSPFDEMLYWSGNWNAKRPSLDRFKTTCRQSYEQADKTSDYANLGSVAHLVCQELSISFQVFEMKINQFVKNFSGEIKLAPATIRREVSGKFRLTSIRPRNEILRERLAAELSGIQSSHAQWIEHRYLEDGMRVNGKLVKLIRWEAAE